MARPDPNNGHIDIPHELAEVLMKIKLTSYQNRIIWCIWRKTFGWHKESDSISLSQFEEMTGMDRRNIGKKGQRGK